MKKNISFIGFLSVIFILSSCVQKNQTDKAEHIVDSIRIPSDNFQIDTIREDITEETANIKYSKKEIDSIMGILNERIPASPFTHNIESWWVAEPENKIYVGMIVMNNEKINTFKKQILNSPAIIFKETIIKKPEEPICTSCGFTMIAEPDNYNLPVKTINVRIDNNTVKEGNTGDYFYMEYYNGDEWETVRLNYIFNSIGHPLYAHESRSFTINLQPETYNYKAGKYRIYKRINTENKNYLLMAAFTLS